MVRFNLNSSRKPDNILDRNLIRENINIYGIPCKVLFSERINEDIVFKDFSHFKVSNKTEFIDLTLLPEDSSNWEGENGFNSFGLFQQYNTNVFVAADDLLEIYPNFLEEAGGRSKILNSLIITPSGTILEITNVEPFTPGVSNLWSFADNPNSYKLTTKIYSLNISDEGVGLIETNIDLSEGNDGEIFNASQDVNTDEIDNFFDSLTVKKDTIKETAKPISDEESPFGTLG